MPFWACPIESNQEKCKLYIRQDFQILKDVTCWMLYIHNVNSSINKYSLSKWCLCLIEMKRNKTNTITSNQGITAWLKHDVRSSGCDFTKYPFQLRREGNSLTFIFSKAAICYVQVLSSRSTSNYNVWKDYWHYHWEVPGILSEVNNPVENCV